MGIIHRDFHSMRAVNSGTLATGCLFAYIETGNQLCGGPLASGNEVTVRVKRLLLMGLPTPLFAVAGFAYYHYVGCTNGSCAIVSSPFLSTGFGALIGAAVGLTISDRRDKDANL
jgi:hypothetical protein